MASCLYKAENEYGMWDVIYALFTMDGPGPFTAYWYLYAYLGFLIVLPFLRRAVINMQMTDMAILVGCHFIYAAFIPLLKVILGMTGLKQLYISGNLSIPFANVAAIFYPILGYYIENNIDVCKINYKHIYGMIATAVTCIAISGACTCYEYSITGQYTQNYVQLFDYVLVAIAYILIKYAVTVRWSKVLAVELSSVVCRIGSLTFGIYLFAPYIRLFFYSQFQNVLDSLHLPILLSAICWMITSMLIGGLLTYTLKKIPVLGKML